MALRMRASKSATGSVNLIFCFSSSRPFAPHRGGEPAAALLHNLRDLCASRALCVERHTIGDSRNRTYQDDFETPGISPLQRQAAEAQAADAELAQKAARPSADPQRLCLRDENFGFRASLTRFAVVAKLCS